MKYVVWILLLSPTALAAACPAGQAKDEATLADIEKTWADALNQHDANALACILADEFEDADPDGKLSDRNSTLAKLTISHDVHHQLSDLHAHVHGDFAYIRGLADAINSQTKIITKVRFTDIYVYRDGRWQCVAGHESLVYAMSH